MLKTVAINLPPLALVPRVTEVDIHILFWAILGFFVLAALTPLLLHLNHRLEVWKRRKKDQEYNENLIKRAVKEGRLAAEMESKKELGQSDMTT